MLPSEISTQCWRSIGRWSCECHIVIITSCIRGCVDIRTSGHKFYIVQSYGTNIQTRFFKSISTRLCVSVSCRVAGVLDVSGILGDGTSTSWCPEIISISSVQKSKQFSQLHVHEKKQFHYWFALSGNIWWQIHHYFKAVGLDNSQR